LAPFHHAISYNRQLFDLENYFSDRTKSLSLLLLGNFLRSNITNRRSCCFSSFLIFPSSLLLLNNSAKNLGFGLGGTLLLLAVVILGWGDWTTFFSNPARIGALVLALIGAIAYGFSGSSGCGIGRHEDPSSRWIFIPLIIIAVAFAWLPPHFDRRNRWTIDGDAVRCFGLILTAVGGYVRVATVFELGHRFSFFVALQSDHRLKTDGFYRFVRHPSYLGALMAMAGWALVFRSLIGLLLTLAMFVPIIARIHAEEDFLVREFGAQYREYQQSTRWRLFPFIY
jgi:protein-S-isoprenylcysteine O-methyltransferase Ste14